MQASPCFAALTEIHAYCKRAKGGLCNNGLLCRLRYSDVHQTMIYNREKWEIIKCANG